MDGHVRHLHCHYRVLGDRDTAPQITYRLNRVVQDDLLKAYEQAMGEVMGEVMGDDSSVIVIRTLHSRIALALREHPNDGQLSRRWGERLAGSVVRRLAASAEGDEDVIRFENQAEYVAAYIVDVIDDRVDARWYYGAFVALKGQPREQRISQVLMDNREHLGETFGQLHRRGYLTKVLALLDNTNLRRLWEEGVRLRSIADDYKVLLHETASLEEPSQVGPVVDSVPQDATDSKNTLTKPIAAGQDKDRQLFTLVMELVDRLGVRDREQLTEAQLFDRYRPQCIVDWRDRSAMTAAVCDVLDFLSAQGVLRRFGSRIPPTTLMALDEALKDYDWLETKQLQSRLLQLLGHAGTENPIARSLTSRQRELIDAISHILSDTGNVKAALLIRQPEAMALFLYGLLIEYQAQWRDDDLAKRLIEALAQIHTALPQHEDSGQLRKQLRQGEVQTVFKELSKTALSPADESIAVVNALGEPALRLLRSLDTEAVLMPESPQIVTRCAGVFLLLRAVADLRLPALVSSTSYPSLEALLLPMFMRLAGEGAMSDGRIDTGLAVLSSCEEVPNIPDLHTIWQGVSDKDHAAFQYAMLSVLAGQRTIGGTHLHIYILHLDDGRSLLIGGDATPRIWPLMRLIDDAVDIGDILAQWNYAWTQSCGRPPEHWVVDAPLLSAMDAHNLDTRAWIIVPDLDEEMGSEHTEQCITDHHKGRDEVLLAFKALSTQQLGLAYTDLQMALIGMVVVRLWARWLKQFSDAGIAYLLDRMIRRDGTLTVDASSIEVELEPAPLDLVIEMAGYTRELERLPWLNGRSVSYRIRR